jgi:hypothetical protein
MRYRQRPVEVEAIQWTGENPDEIRVFLGDTPCHLWPGTNIIALPAPDGNGAVSVKVGAWIVTDPVRGGFGPCPAEVFESIYEPVPASAR